MHIKNIEGDFFEYNLNLDVQSGGNNGENVKESDVEPRLVFHHGIPCGSNMFACDPLQKILAISTL